MKVLIFFILFNSPLFPQSSDFFTKTNKFLKTHVVSGKVNYEQILRNPDDLDSLVSMISEFRLKTASDKQYKKALLINTYNLLVIKNVIDNYPVKNPLKVKGFFKDITFNVGGKTVTLDKLEHEMLFPIDKDPRLHFVLVCAAKGCPVLLPKAYTSENLEEEIRNKTIATLNDPRYVKVEENNIYLSELFKWYRIHFGGNEKGVINFINDYRESKLPENTDISYMKYDWSINELKE
ncbi:MAG: hypothetical protein SCALA702_15810 [Melioribacteraceae bacterium]|nr:MAG: hypothetical protein SCALA702_15810 [Melioribacteraceae bacterium]